MKKRLIKPGLLMMIPGLILSLSAPASAQPPIWAPAYDYRDQPNYYQGNEFLNSDMIGPLVGAAIGGLIGAQIGGGRGKLAATAAGTLIGYVLGGKFMDYMDNRDRYNTGQALEYSGNNHTVAWTNPDTHASYRVTPVNTYRSHDSYCREYVTRAVIDGRSEKVHGTACRQPDGAWQIRN